VGLLFKVTNALIGWLFGIRFIKSRSIKKDQVIRRIFSECSIKESSEGFFYLDPMPTEAQLNEYYQSSYWGSRSTKTYGANVRDLVHYNLLKTYIPEEMTKGKVFLNFGAGHGGISNLCWLDGLDVVNVEPSNLPKFYEQRWTTFQSITDVPDASVNIIYGSHSLEHVQDIEKFKKEVQRILKPKGFLFGEVPNAGSPTNEVQTGKVHFPHTYYFKTDFFSKWFTETLLCKSYEQSHGFDVIERWADFETKTGVIVRALGRID